MNEIRIGKDGERKVKSEQGRRIRRLRLPQRY